MATTRRTPKRAVADVVIDINSSPDPELHGRITRSVSRTREVPLHTNAKGKGKANSNSQSNHGSRKRVLGPVIELTDSESETRPVKTSGVEKKKHRQNEAGPSRPRPFPMMNEIGSPNSLVRAAVPSRAPSENIPNASSSSSLKRKDRETTPLFLPVQDNDEHELNADPGPSQKRASVQDMDALSVENNRDQERQELFLQDVHDHRQPSIPPEDRMLVPEPQPALENPQVAPPAPNNAVHNMNPVEVESIPESERDPTSEAVARVLEIVPDVEPDYVLGLVITHLPNFAAQTPEHVIGLLFEDGAYPRVDKKGKRKATESANDTNEGPPNKRPKIDYAAVDRPFTGGPMYEELALVQLQISFPFIPKAFLRRCLQENRGFYAPTHHSIAAIEKRYENVAFGPRPYVMKATRYNSKRDLKKYVAVVDETFAEERRWLVEHLQDPNEASATTAGAPIAGAEIDGKGKGKVVEPEEEEDEPLEDGTGIECQCCFSEYAFDKMVQCPETHLFCSNCVSHYAATKLGEHNPSINCMHPSGCAQPFPASELRRILSPKLMELYERVKQQKEIQEASLEGLEECPFCEWKCVIETPVEQEKLFRCGNEEGGCGEVSCRLCKKKDHLPKSCKEVEEDKLLDGRHAIEEAMTRALMRNCPKCNKAFVKEAGCNKMTCPNCRTLSCYVCRKVITGYEHFNQAQPGRPSTSRSGGKCLLWDNVEERHAVEVKAAAEKAAADYKRDHPDVEDKDIKVDLPVAPKPPVVQAPQPIPGLNPNLLQPDHWNHAQVNFGFANHNPFLPEHPPMVQVPARQRRNVRGQLQPQLLRANMEQIQHEQQRRQLEEQIDLHARMEAVRQRHQEQQRQIEALRLENQRYIDQAYQQERLRLEQEIRERQQAHRNRLQAQVQHNLRLQQQAVAHQQQAAALRLAAAVRGPADVHAQVQPQRAARAAFPGPPLHGAAGGGNRRARRG